MTPEQYKKILQDLIDDKKPDFDITIEVSGFGIHVNGDWVKK